MVFSSTPRRWPVEPVSVSQVQTYLGCPLQYRFRYIDKIPPPWRPAALAFGSSVHAAVEWFHRERLAGRSPEPEAVAKMFDADWFAQNLEPVVFSEKESKETLAEKGRELVRLYAEQVDGTLPRLIEDRFEIDLVDPETGEIFDVRLRGVIDLVEEDGTLVELKTAARTFDVGSLERHIQLSTYALVRLLATGTIPPLRIDALLKTKASRLERLPATRTVEDLAWTARLILSVAQAIRSGCFFPNPSWRCGECEFLAHCQKWRGE
jgi:putative RecB family exonuclease